MTDKIVGKIAAFWPQKKRGLHGVRTEPAKRQRVEDSEPPQFARLSLQRRPFALIQTPSTQSFIEDQKRALQVQQMHQKPKMEMMSKERWQPLRTSSQLRLPPERFPGTSAGSGDRREAAQFPAERPSSAIKAIMYAPTDDFHASQASGPVSQRLTHLTGEHAAVRGGSSDAPSPPLIPSSGGSLGYRRDSLAASSSSFAPPIAHDFFPTQGSGPASRERPAHLKGGHAAVRGGSSEVLFPSLIPSPGGNFGPRRDSSAPSSSSFAPPVRGLGAFGDMKARIDEILRQEEMQRRHRNLAKLGEEQAAKNAAVGRQIEERKRRENELHHALKNVVRVSCAEREAQLREQVQQLKTRLRCTQTTFGTIDAEVELLEANGLGAQATASELTKHLRTVEALSGGSKEELMLVLKAIDSATAWETELHQQAWRDGDEREKLARDAFPELHEQVSQRFSLVQGITTELRSVEAGSQVISESTDKLSNRLQELQLQLQQKLEWSRVGPPGDRVVGLRDLTPEEEERVAQALGPGDQDERLAYFANIPVTRKDMGTLRGLNWLNDEVINCFLKLLEARAKEDAQSGVAFPKVHFMNTQFYAKLAESGDIMSYCYSNVKRWTRKVDIFSFDFVIVPIHCHGNHWTLALINFRQKRFEYLDSLFGGPGRVFESLRHYVLDESRDKKKASYDLTDWKDVAYKDGIPRQRNGADCGVFMCTNANFIARGAKLNFTQEQAPYLRRRMVLELLSEALLDL